MFTGIVKGALAVKKVRVQPQLASFVFDFTEELLSGLEVGASVALDGVCMTVTSIDGFEVSFDAMQETLNLTTLGFLAEGDLVNIERSFRQDAEVGGHILSGHVDAMATIVNIEASENKKIVHYQLPAELQKYVFKKGFVAVHGCSLTVVDVNRADSTFCISYIPETLRVTTHGHKAQGDRVNIEIDRQTQVIVDTVERVLAEREL